MKRALAAVFLALAALPAAATGVMVMSITPLSVELLVNGSAVHALRPGDTTPEGVRLIEIREGAALLEIDGRVWQMGLGASTASSAVLQADRRGHFLANAVINGVPVRAMVDTGATVIALNMSDAMRLGVDFAGARRIPVRTAGGERYALLVRLASVQVGDILLANVEAAVSEGDELPIVLLGMSFLNQVEMRRSGTTLTLIRRH